MSNTRMPAPVAALDLNASKADAGYVRTRDLPRLLPLWPHELTATTNADRARLLARLRRALRAERQRGLAGHWTYDLARHAQLLRAYRAEVAAHAASNRANWKRSVRRPAMRSPGRETARLLLAARAEAHLLGQIRAGAGIVGSDHRIVVGQTPLLAVLFRRQVVVGA